MVAKKPKAPTKPAYHHGDLRRALLDEAVVMLEEDERADFSLRDLARRLGVSHGAPSHHFRDKGALLEAIATEGFRGLADALEAVSRGPGSPGARLAESGVAYVKFALAHRAHVRVMFAKPPESPPSEECMAESIRAFGALLTLAREAAGKHASDAKVRAVTFASWSSVHGLTMLWLAGPGPVRATSGDTEAGLLDLTRDVTALLARAVAAR